MSTVNKHGIELLINTNNNNVNTTIANNDNKKTNESKTAETKEESLTPPTKSLQEQFTTNQISLPSEDSSWDDLFTIYSTLQPTEQDLAKLGTTRYRISFRKAALSKKVINNFNYLSSPEIIILANYIFSPKSQIYFTPIAARSTFKGVQLFLSQLAKRAIFRPKVRKLSDLVILTASLFADKNWKIFTSTTDYLQYDSLIRKFNWLRFLKKPPIQDINQINYSPQEITYAKTLLPTKDYCGTTALPFSFSSLSSIVNNTNSQRLTELLSQQSQILNKNAALLSQQQQQNPYTNKSQSKHETNDSDNDILQQMDINEDIDTGTIDTNINNKNKNTNTKSSHLQQLFCQSMTNIYNNQYNNHQMTMK